MSVHGGILLGKVWVVQALTDFVSIQVVPNLDFQVQRIGRLFKSLKTGLAHLENKYKGMSADPYLPFPYITSYSTPDTTVGFIYEERLHFDGARQTTAVFRGKDSQGNKFFIKFTTRYNDRAHRLLAEKKYAPQLLHCSEFKRGCGWFIVVMEYIEGDDMHEGSFSGGDLDRVRRAKEILHADGIVFGDLRPNNIMKPKDGSGVLLVDFDWCGKDGGSKYPATLNNHPDCGWHEDVRPSAIMKKEHDDHLFETLTRV
jgi:hypothetical protein